MNICDKLTKSWKWLLNNEPVFTKKCQSFLERLWGVKATHKITNPKRFLIMCIILSLLLMSLMFLAFYDVYMQGYDEGFYDGCSLNKEGCSADTYKEFVASRRWIDFNSELYLCISKGGEYRGRICID